MNLENYFSHFYFLNMDSLFTINSSYTYFFLVIQNIHLQGNVSQNFDLGLCYSFMMLNVKKCIFSNNIKKQL